MACYSPIPAYRGPGGAIVFDSKKGFGDRALSLPCGKCIGCRLDKARSWSIRCAHEAMLHEHNSFVTLTYRQEDLPSDGSLRKAHFQLFMKRLRKSCGKVRYLVAGEYGDTTFRPHYHALLFGVDFYGDRVPWKEKGDYLLYSSPLLDRLWGMGFASIGNVTRISAEYVARYTLKKVSGKVADDRYRRIDPVTGEEFFVEPEFATMSRRPGLGAGWYDRFKRDLYPADDCVLEGRTYMVPRYYDEKLKGEDPDAYASVRAARARKSVERDDIVAPYGLPAIGEGDRTPERLETRREVRERKAFDFKRDGV